MVHCRIIRGGRRCNKNQNTQQAKYSPAGLIQVAKLGIVLMQFALGQCPYKSQMAAVEIVPAAAESNCPAACPTDNVHYTNAIQSCISNQSIVELVAGSPGYIIDNGSGNGGENAALVLASNKTLKTVGYAGNCRNMSGSNPNVDYNNSALLKASIPSNNNAGNVLNRPMFKVTGGGVTVNAHVKMSARGSFLHERLHSP